MIGRRSQYPHSTSHEIASSAYPCSSLLPSSSVHDHRAHPCEWVCARTWSCFAQLALTWSLEASPHCTSSPVRPEPFSATLSSSSCILNSPFRPILSIPFHALSFPFVLESSPSFKASSPPLMQLFILQQLPTLLQAFLILTLTSPTTSYAFLQPLAESSPRTLQPFIWLQLPFQDLHSWLHLWDSKV